MTALHRRAVAALLLAAAAVAIVLGTGAPASAHASLIRSDPAQGAVVDTAPDTVRFTFTESVAAVPEGIRVLDAEGAPVASSATAAGEELAVTIDEPVAEGTLVVLWRVVSADGHPVSGSLTFSVGAPSDDATPPPAQADDTVDAPLLLGIVRGVGYLALLLTAGVVAFSALLLPAGPGADPARRRLSRTARVAATTAAVVWLVQLPLTAAYLLGGGMGALARGSTWAALPPAEYVVTAAVVAGIVLSVILLRPGIPTGSRAIGAVASAAIAVAAPAFTGHTRAESPLALVIGTDMLHLLAGSIWLGGLVALALTLRTLADSRDAAQVVARFSTLAAGILAALVATGSVLGWRIIGSWDALFDTTYGWLLIVKVSVVLVAVGIAAWNRYRLVPHVREASKRQERRTGTHLLTRATTVEACVLVVALGLTGFLVDRSPQAEAAAAERARNSVRTAMLGDVEVTATMTPLLPGTNTVTIEMRDAEGEPFEGFEAPELSLSSGAVDTGMLTLSNKGPGHYTGPALIPSGGTWELRISLRATEFDNPVATVAFTVDGG